MKDWQQILEQARESLPESVATDDPRSASDLAWLAALSPWCGRQLAGDPELAAWLADPGVLDQVQEPEAIAGRLEGLRECRDSAALMRGLRQARRREHLLTAARDLLGRATLDETLTALSAFADHAIALACDWLEAEFRKRFGTPRDARGEPVSLVVLGMGKLGGGELNFSSDVDLIFLFPERGQSDGLRQLDNEEFFTRLGRELIRVLDEITADGQVYRVDMRLRPFGASGPLVMSFDGAETYYQLHGREWERYAFIKARAVAGDRVAGERFLCELSPFVYRRYLDYAIFESLREMKDGIMREVARQGLEDNIKLGRGGIREVEFVVQLYQLIRGGRDPELRQRGLRSALAAVVASGHLTPKEGERLSQAYEFLRRLENRLQAQYDQQTHQLPDKGEDRLRLARAMGEEHWDAVAEEFAAHRAAVRSIFESIFVGPKSPSEDGADRSLEDLWHDRLDDERARNLLADLGFAQPATAHEQLRTLAASGPVTRMGERGRKRMDRIMPRIIQAASSTAMPDTTLERMLRVLGAIARRTAYLALLAENPPALEHMARLCATSAWVAARIAEQPLLLDELIDPRIFQAPPDPETLARELDEALARADGDGEREMEALREWRQTAVFSVAVADLTGVLEVAAASEQLTRIAELVVDRVHRLARADLESRHGRPRCGSEGRAAQFAVIGYGKLGSGEMSYGSDLDIVFIHDSHGDRAQTDGEKRPVDNAVFFSRLAQRMIHMLTTQTPAGTLYEVDTRLRPSGSAGLLVTGIDAFRSYQSEQAWTWEHQALLRARPISGDPEVVTAFREARREILARKRDPERLREDIRAMRERMVRARTEAAGFDCKHDAGGLLDVEFLVQYWALLHAAEVPGMLDHTDTLGLLAAVGEAGLVDADAVRTLETAARSYRQVIHAETLAGEPAAEIRDQARSCREWVVELWNRTLGPVV